MRVCASPLSKSDYYVTEALRCIAQAAPGKIIFKGGTSLSKGWNLIQRFSEDIDIFLDPEAFVPPLGRNAINREMKNLSDAVAAHPALVFVPVESQTIGGFGRNDRFKYEQKFGGPGEPANRVLLEAGAASGRQPVQEMEIESYLAAIPTPNRNESLGASDEAPFLMNLLHFRRTFVEKLFVIHAESRTLQEQRVQNIGSYARHYYDLYQLIRTPEVADMLRSEEYGGIIRDYDRGKSGALLKELFPCRQNLRFGSSDALYPSEDLGKVIGGVYEEQCRTLCYGAYPSWKDLLSVFANLRERL